MNRTWLMHRQQWLRSGQLARVMALVAVVMALPACVGGPRIRAGDADKATSTGSAQTSTQRPAAGHRGHRIEPYSLDTGQHTQASDAKEAAKPFDEVVRVTGAPWLRLNFSDVKLGAGSYVQLTSLEDGGTQRLDADTLQLWNNASAFFNGDAVRVELFIAPGDADAYAKVNTLTVGERGMPDVRLWSEPGEGQPPGGEAPTSLCGVDNRVASGELRTGRLWGHVNSSCTAWLVSNGAALTAGHCVDLDPDGFGPGLPNGVLDLNGVVEFDVPLSDPDGTVNMAAPEDQFPINLASVVWNFDGEGQGLGKDWAVFRVNPNTGTGARPHVTRGFYRMTNTAPAAGQDIRVTGYGSDGGTANFTNQTHNGPYVGESVSGANFWHRYQVDTTGGNSGSPILWTSNGYTIGIHTNAGCAADGSGANSGTSFEHNPLETAIQSFPGANTRYADAVAPYPSSGENGLIFSPYNTVGEAVGAVAAGGRVSIVEGTYNEGAQTVNKAVTLEAPVGTVVIR